MIEEGRNDVAIAGIAPEGEVSEAEDDRMVSVGAAVCDHVTINVAAAAHGFAVWLEADPVLAGMLTVRACIIDMYTIE